MDEHDVPAGEPWDDLGTASLTVDRLRRFLTDASTPAEDAEARRWLDRIAGRTCRA